MSTGGRLEQPSAYDVWHEKVHGHELAAENYLQDWHRNALGLSPPVEGLDVLEVGCGSGDFSLYLAGLNARVTSVDSSSRAIATAQEKAKVQRRPVEFLRADAQSLPFDDSRFDLIYSCECLEHIPSPMTAMNEFYRVLKPSGRLIITTENYSNAMLLAWIVAWMRKEPFNSGAGVQPVEHFFVYWKIKKMLRSAGFRVNRMRGSHHVFLLLPRFDPSTFVVNHFHNNVLSIVFRPFARHMTFEATKKRLDIL